MAAPDRTLSPSLSSSSEPSHPRVGLRGARNCSRHSLRDLSSCVASNDEELIHQSRVSGPLPWLRRTMFWMSESRPRVSNRPVSTPRWVGKLKNVTSVLHRHDKQIQELRRLEFYRRREEDEKEEGMRNHSCHTFRTTRSVLYTAILSLSLLPWLFLLLQRYGYLSIGEGRKPPETALIVLSTTVHIVLFRSTHDRFVHPM